MTILSVPSARQPVTVRDANGNETFTRPWFLFFQAVFERVGGSIGPSTTDIVDSLDQTGSPETDAAVYALADEIRIEPNQALQEEVAELKKAVQALQQGTSL